MFWLGLAAPLMIDASVIVVGRGHRPCAGRNAADRKAGRRVQCEDAFDGRLIQRPVCNYPCGAAVRLFTRLKDEHDRVDKLLAHCSELRRETEQYPRVHIVHAGMHHACVL